MNKKVSHFGFRKEGLKTMAIPTLAVAVLLSVQTLSATTLSGIFEFSTDSSGNPAVSSSGYINVWNTQPGDLGVDMFVTQGPGLSNPFINGPTDADASISIPLHLGANSFVMFGGSGAPAEAHAINLFFNGNNTSSGISAFGLTQTSAVIPGFSPDGQATYPLEVSGTTDPNFPATTIPGANSLSYLDGDRLITLTSYSWADPSVYNADRVASPPGDWGHVESDGVLDSVGHLTLTVTQVPEPTAAALMTTFALGMCRVMKNNKKSVTWVASVLLLGIFSK